MHNKRLAGLHQLCSAFHDLSQYSDDSVDACPFNNAIISALQLYLVLDLGGLLSSTVDTLCRSLYTSLVLVLSEVTCKTDSQAGSFDAKMKHCEVWLLLTGFLATATQPSLRFWFREEALLRLQALQVTTEPEVTSLCDPFCLGIEVLSPAFLRCAIGLEAAALESRPGVQS